MRPISMTVVLALMVTMASCASFSEPSYDNWEFIFNMSGGHQDAAVLTMDLRSEHYSLDSIGTKDVNDQWKPYYRSSFSGSQERPQSLDITWREENTKAIYSQTVDFRGRLPISINNTAVHFVISNNKLYVFLAYINEPSPPGQELPRWINWGDKRNLQIFPNPKEDKFHSI